MNRYRITCWHYSSVTITSEFSSYHIIYENFSLIYFHIRSYISVLSRRKEKKENYTKNIDISIKKKKKTNEKRNEAWESQSGSGALRDRQAHREAVVQPQGIRVRFVLAYARMRALIPTAGSFIETTSSRVTARRRVVGITVHHLVGERWRRGDAVCMAYGVRARSGERGDSFSMRQPERRMRLRQSSRSLMIYHSPYRSLSLPPLCSLVFVCLSVSNIEFSACIRGSLCSTYRQDV